MNFLLLRVLRRTQRESAEVTAQAGAKLPVKVIRARRLVQAAASVPDLRAVRCLYSRLPKRGFNNKFRKEYVIVNLSALANVAAGTVVDYEYVMANKLAKQVKDNSGLKVLGSGELTNALTVKAAKFSASAKEAIEKAGGTAETL